MLNSERRARLQVQKEGLWRLGPGLPHFTERQSTLFPQFLRRFLRLGTAGGWAWRTSKLENVSFISRKLVGGNRRPLPDPTRREGTFIYILASTIERGPPHALRLLAYMVRILRRCVEEAGSESRRMSYLLPPVIPVVINDGMLKRTWLRPSS
jgi:hypothetical protein